ncbi:phage portal protein [Pseudomonas sp. PARCl1]|uniref:phage portal protein n=1 Tax=Pseudomonas sp. PARCl1 TaxID=2853444 RepID=UPI001C74A3FE|nr:phage portal protein [Pseudomonas sp. PARCl1]QXM18721.1 portal protein [Pseudomonas phage PARCL1pr]
MFHQLSRKSAGAIATSAALAEALGSYGGTYAGQRVSTRRAMQLATVFSCVRVLAESVGMLPCKLYKQNGRERIGVTGNKLSTILQVAPNGYMTAQEFWELLVVCLALRGNFYAYKVEALGKLQELLPMDPGAVRPRMKDDWELVYDVTWRDGKTETLGQDKIWHVRLFTLDGFTGLNPVAYARQAIALGLSTEEHGAKLFENGAVTSGVLSTDQALSDAAFGRLKQQFNDEHGGGLTNAHKPMVLEMGLTWKPVSLNLEDSQFLETRKYQRSEICGLFRIPPHMVGDLEKATFSNIEHQGADFLNNALVPILTRIEARVRVGLMTDKERETHFAKFNTAALLRGDLKSRLEAYGIGINWGMWSPNDCLAKEDENPRPGGDVYLTPMNMTTKPEGSNSA